MLVKLFQEIQNSAKVEQVTIDDRRYTSAALVPVKKPEPAAIAISTLTGLVEFYDKCEADTGPNPPIVVVDGPQSVRLVSILDEEFQQRGCFLVAKNELRPFPFGQYLDIDTFIVSMLSMFVQDEMTKTILQILGTLQDGTVLTFDDDGTSQKVTAKTGIARVGDTKVPNPVTLAPFRSFPEIEQPASRFVLRMRSGSPMPTCALFEADGGAWRNEAIARIKKWVVGKLPEAVVLA
ncbi:MAG: VWA domain-containing protein [Deltaproteobacteria bacterium]|nr:VWA domain-containing protein [Deltaproteobacteria bacterium]